VGALGVLLWAGLTYDPARNQETSVLVLPLPAHVTPEAEAPAAASANAEPDATVSKPAPTVPAAPEPAPVPAPALSPVPAPTAPPAAAPPSDRAENAPPAEPPVSVPMGPESLSPAPDRALIEPGKDGPLPKIGANGRKPWTVYARPFEASNPRPRIAIIVSGLGQSAAATETAIQALPPAVTLAFSPYGQRLQYWTARARAAGHETLVLVPMEPVNYPANDAGPQTLLTTSSPAENRDKLNWALSRFTGYVGALSLFGSRYTTAPESLRPTLEEINARGLMFVDSRSSLRSSALRIAGEIGLPRASSNRFIDIQASRDEIDRRLDELAKIATTSGFAVGIGQPYPATIERVAAFVRAADERGLAIAPVSAIADHQKE
jgi:uncharacterized protein